MTPKDGDAIEVVEEWLVRELMDVLSHVSGQKPTTTTSA
jgi:hypothetical protein